MTAVLSFDIYTAPCNLGVMYICDYTESLQAKPLDERIDRYHRINRDDDFLFVFGRY
jgi:hypothetical protein